MIMQDENIKQDENDIQVQPVELPQDIQETEELVSGSDDEEDDALSSEEIEAALREHRSQKQNQNQQNKNDEEEDNLPMPADNPVNPYLEEDPSIYKLPYKEPLFMTRGCHNCPDSYKAVPEQELNSCCKLNSKNWMSKIKKPFNENNFDVVEVRFKNNRKDYFRLPDGLEVTEGDVVAVEGVPGHDVGIVSLTGELCRIQMKRRRVDPNSESIKRLFRRAKKSDIDKWAESIQKENATLIRTRQISEEQNLVMKINDVEMQSDCTKAIFYYTADERVDFRNLIKVLAEEFKVRVEMKQIGVRQEAGKVGGIGTCGRELCCSTWLTNFQSVTTSVAKAQQILPNPQKLAGQCGKLKCCLNFEHEVYLDALKEFPPANTPVRTKKGLALYKKTDVLRGVMWYAYEGENELIAIPAKSVKEIIAMNNRQEYPEKLEDFQIVLASGTAMIDTSTNNAEFERELKMLADNGSDSGDKGRDQQQNKGGHRNNRQQNQNGERKQNNNRQQKQNNGNQHQQNGTNQQKPQQKQNNGAQKQNNGRNNNKNRNHSNKSQQQKNNNAPKNEN